MTRSMNLCLVLATAACGGDDVPAMVDAPATADAAAPRQVVMETKALLVGEIGEGKLIGGLGDRAVITVTAPVAKLDWNIHGHANGSTQTVQEAFAVMTIDYTFEPTAQAEWYLLLRNQHSAPMDVDVKIELFGDLTWSGWL